MRLTALALTMLGSACVADTLDEPGAAPELRDAHCVLDDPAVRCAYLDVPASRADGGAEIISLFVKIIPARAPDDRAPLVVLAGGPGSTILSGLWLEHPAREHHDIVLMDQRGTGLSEPSLHCGELEAREVRDAGGSLDDPLIGEALREAASACRARYLERGVDLSAFNTEESAADVDDLRRALGAKQLNLHGHSYGTRLALEVMREFPDRVRSAALFGTYPQPFESLSDAAVNSAAALRAVLAACAEDPDCPAADPQTAFEQRMAELDEHPIDVPLDDGSHYAWTSADAGLQLFKLMYSTEKLPDVPHVAITGVAPERDDAAAASSADPLDGSHGLYLSVTCREDYPFADRERADRAPFYMRGLRWDTLTAVAKCEGWDVPAAPAGFKEPVRSDVPTLLVVGRFDPITPPRYSQHAAETLSRSQVIEVPGAGHDAQTRTPCVRDMLTTFLDDPSTPVDATCVDELDPVDF